jgi:hypothetical protein
VADVERKVRVLNDRQRRARYIAPYWWVFTLVGAGGPIIAITRGRWTLVAFWTVALVAYTWWMRTLIPRIERKRARLKAELKARRGGPAT